MCGIAAVVNLEGIGESDLDSVSGMLSELEPRGPDAQALWTDERYAALAAARLAILDVEGSPQPVVEHDGHLVLVYNGELYNLEELRRKVRLGGRVCTTGGDAELVLRLYQADPGGFVEDLDGMFSLALWDGVRRRLTIARDRLGIKPLYVTRRGKRVALASELGALVRCSDGPWELDREAIDSYLQLRFVLPPRTPFVGVEKVEPGTICVLDDEGWRERRFASRELGGGPPLDGAAVREILEEDLPRSLRCEVPTAVWTSGGLDSSTVAAYAARNGTSLACSVGYAGRETEDESGIARRLSADLGIDHRVAVLSPDDALATLGAVQERLGEPVYTPVTVSTYHLARFTASRARVALTGDGADELFMGYRRFRNAEGKPASTDEHARELGWIPDEWRLRLLRGGERRGPSQWVDDWVAPDVPDVDRPRWFELFAKLPEYHLNRVDRLSMAWGLEARPVLLQRRMIDLAMRTPTTNLVAERPKNALRVASSARLGSAWAGRRKRKFTAPSTTWLKAGWPEARALLLNRELVSIMGLNERGTRSLIEAFERAPAQHSGTVWGVVVLLSWAEHVALPALSGQTSHA